MQAAVHCVECLSATVTILGVADHVSGHYKFVTSPDTNEVIHGQEYQGWLDCNAQAAAADFTAHLGAARR